MVLSTERGFDRYRGLIDDWEAFCRAAERPLPTCVWTNTVRSTPTQVQQWLERDGVACQRVPWFDSAFTLPPDINPGRKLAYLAGLIHVQEEVSLLPIAALGPKPGDVVLDLCAAPGNKTVQTAVALENRGTVIANDRSGIRLNVLRAATHRLGLTNVSTTVGDAATFPTSSGYFDSVIADVPCSCEGTSRKHPNVMGRSSQQQSLGQAVQQRAILTRAVDLCRPGGRVVYSTCTYAPEENELVVDAVLRSRPELRVVPVEIPRLLFSAGITEWSGRQLHSSLRHALRVWPHQNDTGGFFVALIARGDGG